MGSTTSKLDQTETNTWQFFGKISKKVSESFRVLLKVGHLKNKMFFQISRTGILTRRCKYLFAFEVDVISGVGFLGRKIFAVSPFLDHPKMLSESWIQGGASCV